MSDQSPLQEVPIPPDKSGVAQGDRAQERPRNFDKANTVSMKVTVGVRTGYKDFEVSDFKLSSGRWEYQLKEKATGQLWSGGDWVAETKLKDPS